MTIFNARVDGARAEDGKVIFDVDVNGQKSSPWTYKKLPLREDLWGLNIHTSGEERDHIANAISAYARDHSGPFARAQAQTILINANSTCLRCAQSSIEITEKLVAACAKCGASYALAGSEAARATAATPRLNIDADRP